MMVIETQRHRASLIRVFFWSAELSMIKEGKETIAEDMTKARAVPSPAPLSTRVLAIGISATSSA